MSGERGPDHEKLTERERHLLAALAALAQQKAAEQEKDPLYRFYRLLVRLRKRLRRR